MNTDKKKLNRGKCYSCSTKTKKKLKSTLLKKKYILKNVNLGRKVNIRFVRLFEFLTNKKALYFPELSSYILEYICIKKGQDEKQNRKKCFQLEPVALIFICLFASVLKKSCQFVVYTTPYGDCSYFKSCRYLLYFCFSFASRNKKGILIATATLQNVFPLLKK